MWKLKNFNFTKDPITTIFGIGLAIVSIVSIFTNGTSVEAAGAGVIIGLGIAGFKDGNGTAGVAAILLIVCIRCVPPPTTTSEIRDSTITQRKEITVTDSVPGDKVSDQLTCPTYSTSQIDAQTNKPTKEVIGIAKPKITQKKSKRALLTTTVQPSGKIDIDCECLPENRAIKAFYNENTRLRTELKTVTKHDCKTPWYDLWARYIAIAGILFAFIKLLQFLTKIAI
jgi:hypothetical protein